MDCKYGKSNKDIIKFKQNFIHDNQKMLDYNNSVREIYLQQPRRTNCKLCGTSLEGAEGFHSHGINYYFCPQCGHLNGECEETKEYAEKLFIETDYKDVYMEAEKERYFQRVDSIYKPKMQFLLDSLKKDGLSNKDINVFDIGAGSGYLVAAANDLGIASEGIEISKAQVDYANKMNNADVLRVIHEDELANEILNTKSNVLSAIGVFVHLVELPKVLAAIQSNKNIDYVYICVPMFSFSCIFEAANPNVFNRLLGGGHSNLFTEESLDWLCEHYGFDKFAKWQFGCDALDLYRSLCVELENTGNAKLKDYFTDKYMNLLDDIQLIFDKADFSSEIHLILKRKEGTRG